MTEEKNNTHSELKINGLIFSDERYNYNPTKNSHGNFLRCVSGAHGASSIRACFASVEAPNDTWRVSATSAQGLRLRQGRFGEPAYKAT